MGVKGLWRLLLPIGRRISIETLQGKILAIDASIWMTQFLKAMRDVETGRVQPAAHLIGFLRRLCKLRFQGIRPVFVFDGATPEIKQREVAQRRKRREEFAISQGDSVQRMAKRILLQQLKNKGTKKVVPSTSSSSSSSEKERLRILLLQKKKIGLAANRNEEPRSKNSSFAPGFYDPEGESNNKEDEKSNNDHPDNSKGEESKDDNIMSAQHQEATEILELSDGEDYLELPSSAPQGPSDWDAAIPVEDLDDSEETKDDTKEALKQSLRSSMTNDFDADFVASLPSTQRKDWVEDAKRKQRMQSRQEFMQVAADPQGLSQCQLRNFLKSTKLNQNISKMAVRAAKDEGIDNLSSDRSRKIIFEKDGHHDEGKERTPTTPKSEAKKRKLSVLASDSDSDGDSDNDVDWEVGVEDTKPAAYTTAASSTAPRAIMDADSESDDDGGGGGFFTSDDTGAARQTTVRFEASSPPKNASKKKRRIAEDDADDDGVGFLPPEDVGGGFLPAGEYNDEEGGGGFLPAEYTQTGNRSADNCDTASMDEMGGGFFTSETGTSTVATSMFASASASLPVNSTATTGQDAKRAQELQDASLARAMQDAEQSDDDDAGGGFLLATSSSKPAPDMDMDMDMDMDTLRRAQEHQDEMLARSLQNDGSDNGDEQSDAARTDEQMRIDHDLSDTDDDEESPSRAARKPSMSMFGLAAMNLQTAQEEEDEQLARAIQESAASFRTATKATEQIIRTDDDGVDDDDRKPPGKPRANTATGQTRVIKMKRQGGEVVQTCDIYIGRQCNMGGWRLPKSKWHSPFTVKECGSATLAVEKYRTWITTQPKLLTDIGELKDKVLGCWCKPGPCHGDVLVELANKLDPDTGANYDSTRRAFEMHQLAKPPVPDNDVARRNPLFAFKKRPPPKSDRPDNPIIVAHRATRVFREVPLRTRADEQSESDTKNSNELNIVDLTNADAQAVDEEPNAEDEEEDEVNWEDGADDDDEVNWEDGDGDADGSETEEKKKTKEVDDGLPEGSSTFQTTATSNVEDERLDRMVEEGPEEGIEEQLEDEYSDPELDADIGGVGNSWSNDFKSKSSADTAAALEQAQATAAQLTDWAGRAFRRAVARHAEENGGAIGSLSNESMVSREVGNKEKRDDGSDQDVAMVEDRKNEMAANAAISPTRAAKNMSSSDSKITATKGTKAKNQAVSSWPEALSGESTLEDLEQYQEQWARERNQQERDMDTVTDEMKIEVMQLLQLFGIPYIEAPAEAEAQCVALEQLGLVDGIVTEDSDAFVFGGQIVYKNIFDDQKYVEVYHAQDAEKEMNLTHDGLVALAMLLGGDYTEGVKGVGIVNGMEILQAFEVSQDLRKGLLEFRKWLDGFDPADALGIKKGKEKTTTKQVLFHQTHHTARTRWIAPKHFPDEKVLAAYLNPVVDKSEDRFSWGVPDLDKLIAFFNRHAGWNPEETRRLLEPVVKKVEDGSGRQTRIDSFMMRYEDGIKFANVRSKRLREVLYEAQSKTAEDEE
jgi:5'-3' exonuclease